MNKSIYKIQQKNRQQMQAQQKILIKDPYLSRTFQSDLPQPSPYLNLGNQNTEPENNKWKMEQEIRKQLQHTQNQYKRMTRAYTDENMLNRKMLDFQTVNGEYHEALKYRNLDLNNKLNNLNTQNYLMANRMQNDLVRNHHEKDLILRKYESQSDELLQARKTINNLLEHKTRLQQQLQHLTFMLQRETDRFSLQMKEQLIRMESIQRSMKQMTETKDQQISQLRNRLRNYEDQNKRLNDENRSLHITRTDRDKQNRGIQNLSQINCLDSNTKDFKDVENKTINKQLQDQRVINERLQREIQDLKKNLFNTGTNNFKVTSQQFEKQRKQKSKEKDIQGNKKHSEKQDFTNQNINPDGLIKSLETLRGGINKQIFQIFYKSVKDGEKHRSNSLVIFIENWKLIDLQRIQPYIESYFESRQNLKQLCLSEKYKGKPIHQKMQQTIPLRIGLRKGRNEVNLWILSTIQFTKNQRETSKNTLNNLLLFLFRLLTIQYRITYPMQGKSYTIDNDVRNQLHHQTVKAIRLIIDFQ